MTAYGLPTGASDGRTVPSGLLPACLAAIALLLVQIAGVRWGLDLPGLGAIRSVNDGVIAATAPLLLQAITVSALAGTYLAVGADDRRAGVLTDASQKALVVIVLVCVLLLPLLSGRPLLGVPRSANLLLLVLVAELAVAIGVGIGYTALYRPALTPVILAATLTVLATLLARSILTQALLPDMPVTSVFIGMGETARGIQELRAWSPRVHAGAIAMAVAASGLSMPAVRGRALRLAAVAGTPLVLTAVTVLLAMCGAGGAAAGAYGPGFWLWSVGGAACGYAAALLLASVLERG